MPKPTAVIFDLDGTLTDTEEVWDEVRRGLAAQDGRPWPEGATRAMMGMSTREWSTYLAETVGLQGSAADAERRTLDALSLRYHAHVPVLPGAVEAVRRMAARGPIGLASSSPRRIIEVLLERMGVRELFAVVRSTEEGAGRGKPAPDAFLWVCGHLGVEPADAVAVEDSTNGLLAAHNAGMRIIAIPPAFRPPTAESLALADLVLADLSGLTVEAVADVLAQ